MKRQTLKELLAEIEENRKNNIRMMPYLVIGLAVGLVVLRILAA